MADGLNLTVTGIVIKSSIVLQIGICVRQLGICVRQTGICVRQIGICICIRQIGIGVRHKIVSFAPQ